MNIILFTVFHFIAGPPLHGSGAGMYYGDTLRLPERRYTEATAGSQHLYNGVRYHFYDRTAETHQFFETREIFTGHIRYDGRSFGPVQMHYDVNLNQLAIKHPTGGYLISPDMRKVEAFNLDNHRFVRIKNHPQLPDAIYQIMWDGPTQLLSQRKKSRNERTENRQTFPVYLDENSYYVKTGDNFHKIKHRKDLYVLFPTKKKELRAYFRSLRQPFRENPDGQLTAAVKILDN